MSILDYRIGPANKTLQAMQASDPEVAVKAEEVLQTQEPANQDQNFFQRLLNFVNPFSPAGAAEPDISPITGLPVNTNTKFYPGTTVPIATPFSDGQSNFPFRSAKELATEFDPKSIQSIFPTNFPAGITQSAAAQEFRPEAPYQIIGGQKVYIGDVIGKRRAEERANFVKPPKRTAAEFTLDTINKGIKTLSNFLPGMSIVNMMDKFDSLPYLDRQFIKSRMAKVGTSGGDFYKDPKSGLFKDKAGLGIRSLRGNYAKTIDKEFNRYDKAVKRAEAKYGVKWDGEKFVNAETNEVDENAELANKRNRRNIDMFQFFQNQKNERDEMRRKVIEKMKNQESAPIQKNFPITNTGGGGLTEAEKKAFAPRQDTFTKVKTVTLSDGRQYSSPK